jgi:hypothetical protein
MTERCECRECCPPEQAFGQIQDEERLRLIDEWAKSQPLFPQHLWSMERKAEESERQRAADATAYMAAKGGRQ